MTQDVKFVILVTLLLGHKKCGEWPYLFATIGTQILLDIAALESILGPRKYFPGIACYIEAKLEFL